LVIAWIRKRIINKKIYKIWEEQKFNTVENKEISEKNTNIK